MVMQLLFAAFCVGPCCSYKGLLLLSFITALLCCLLVLLVLGLLLFVFVFLLVFNGQKFGVPLVDCQRHNARSLIVHRVWQKIPCTATKLLRVRWPRIAFLTRQNWCTRIHTWSGLRVKSVSKKKKSNEIKVQRKMGCFGNGN